MFWVWGLGSDLYMASCATCPSGTSFYAVLAAPRRRLHLPGVPLSREAAAPRAQELCADSPTGKSASTADLPVPRLLRLLHERDEQGTDWARGGCQRGWGRAAGDSFLIRRCVNECASVDTLGLQGGQACRSSGD